MLGNRLSNKKAHTLTSAVSLLNKTENHVKAIKYTFSRRRRD